MVLNVAKIAEHANNRGIEELTVYAFSTENWKRPQERFEYLMSKPLKLSKKLPKIKQYMNQTLRIRF